MTTIRRTAGVILFLFAAIVLAGCSEGPTESDKKALARLEAKFGEQFTFEFSGEQYVLVRARGDAPPGQGQGYGIYKLFRASEENQYEKRVTSFIFMNFYDSSNNFLFQAGPGGITDIEFY